MSSLSTSGPIRVHRDANGDVHVVADLPSPSFRGSFRVIKAGRMEVRVGLGAVEDIIPIIGKEPLHAKRLPKLPLTSGPNGDLFSWVALRVTVDLTTGLIDRDNPESAQVVHINDYALLSERGLAPDDGEGHGYHPLALIVWQSAQLPRQIVQNTWFNQRHRFYPGAKGTRGIHEFRPVL